MTENNLEAVAREIEDLQDGAENDYREGDLDVFPTPMLVAARLILEARRERDGAQSALEQLQHEHKGLCDHHVDMCRKAHEDLATLRAERANALADREDMRRTLKRLTQERDAAVDCYDHIKAERDAALARVRELERLIAPSQPNMAIRQLVVQDMRQALRARIERREKEWTRSYEGLEAEGAANRKLREAYERCVDGHIAAADEACNAAAAYDGANHEADFERLRAALAGDGG